jgi:8-oxo-dGTP diphosphatase
MTTVVAAILERDGKILICQRRPRDPHPLKWEFPGGKLEPGETPAEALRRELEEELGIDARIDAEITRYQYCYPGRQPILLIFYRVIAFSGEPRNLVFERMVWDTPARLRQYDFLEGDVDFVRTLT